jgi:hypothetical protein
MGPVPVSPYDELPVRVVVVPKTQSIPRIIAIEPSTMQYAQQAVKREIYEWIGRGPLSKVLGFSDQTRNQEMARIASSTKKFATLDLSEASDRVHWFLVYSMLRRYPHLWDFVWASRSIRADVEGDIFPLQKFASMGSALTFPIETMIFTILAALGMKEQGYIRSISPRSLQGELSVYGDDIIVPVDTTGGVIDWLEHFGARVNQNKSFWNGNFRESCGAEYFDGHDVTVVRLRAELPSSRHDAAAIAGYIDLRNRMFFAGMWSVVSEIDKELESLIKLRHVYASQVDTVGFMFLATFCRPSVEMERFNSDYHYHEVRVPMLKPVAQSYKIDGEPGLLEWFHSSLRRGDLDDRYDSKERASSFNIKRRWIPSYLLGGRAE